MVALYPSYNKASKNFCISLPSFFYQNELSNHQLLKSEELGILRKNLDKEDFGERASKLLKHAASVKNNLQLRRNSDFQKFSTLITKKILAMK